MLQLRINHLPLPITSPILLLILFIQIATNVAHCSNIDSSVQAQKLCSTPPDWRFYDIVNHLAAIEVTPDVAPNVTTFTDSTNSSIVTTVTVTDATVANQQNATVAAPIQFRYNQNGSTLEDVTVLNPIHEFFREPFGNIRNNVTMIVLTNLQEHRLRNEQQIYNLEQIYRSLMGVHLKNIRFILINSRESFNPRWVWETRKRVSFEVYQEVPTSPIIGSLLKGGNGDIFIYDRCALLTYYIPFPLSFIHTQQPILQAAILATYFDSPCKARCDNNSTTIATSSSQSNDTSNVATEVATSTLATNLPEPPTADTVSTTIAPIVTTLTTTEEENATIVAIPEQTDSLNVTDASTPIATVANQTVTSTTTAEPGLNEMGQILMKFFGQILPQSTSPVQSVVTNATIPDSVQNETKIELNSEVQQNIVAVNQTTEVKIETNVAVSNGTVTVETKQNTTIVTATRPGSSTSSTLLNRLRYSHKVEESTCNTQVCNEWSTERLLKARLCCLNFQNVEDNDPDTPATLPPQNIANLDGSNLDSHFEPNETVQDGSFGCHVYARWRCNRIMPVIKCCLRKVLNKYFDFTIKLREQQQKAQMMNGHQSSSPLMPQPLGGSGGHYSLKTHLLNEGPNVSIEYPGDYVLQHHHSGSSQSQFQQDYFKQQHRKRMLQQRSNARA